MTVTEMKHQARMAEWKEKILDCRSSGMSVKQWCAENNVSDVTYYRWEREIFGRAKIRENNPPAVVEPVFAELPAPEQASPTVVPESPNLVACLRLEKAELSIYAGADPEVVKTLCTVLNLC